MPLSWDGFGPAGAATDAATRERQIASWTTLFKALIPAKAKMAPNSPEWLRTENDIQDAAGAYAEVLGGTQEAFDSVSTVLRNLGYYNH